MIISNILDFFGQYIISKKFNTVLIEDNFLIIKKRENEEGIVFDDYIYGGISPYIHKFKNDEIQINILRIKLDTNFINSIKKKWWNIFFKNKEDRLNNLISVHKLYIQKKD